MSGRKQSRWAVTAVNHETGETWSIHDTKPVCERAVKEKLEEWGTPDAPFTLIDITDEVAEAEDEPAPVSEPPVVAEGDGVSDTVE